MLTLENVKSLVKSSKVVNRYALPNERQVRRAISDLVLEGLVYIPLTKNTYYRIDDVNELKSYELDKMNKYLDTELKSAIKLIRRIRKLEKFMNEEQLKKLHGELL